MTLIHMYVRIPLKFERRSHPISEIENIMCKSFGGCIDFTFPKISYFIFSFMVKLFCSHSKTIKFSHILNIIKSHVNLTGHLKILEHIEYLKISWLWL